MTTERAVERIAFIQEEVEKKISGLPPLMRDRTSLNSIKQALEVAVKAILDQKERENPHRLTIEELERINAPVWVSCFTLEGDPGYWCLCHKGIIICPSGQTFDAKEIPHWKFYLHEPKEG